MQDVLHFCVSQARGVILKRQMVLVIDAKTSQAISVRKRSQRVKLFLVQRLLQFVGCFDECHGGHYSSPSQECLRLAPRPCDPTFSQKNLGAAGPVVPVCVRALQSDAHMRVTCLYSFFGI